MVLAVSLTLRENIIKTECSISNNRNRRSALLFKRLDLLKAEKGIDVFSFFLTLT